MERAASVFTGAPILTVAFNAHLGAYLAVYSEPLTNAVHMRTAAALTGPWSRAARLFTADRGSADGWVYDAVWHSEYDLQHGKILYLTHSRPTGEGWFDAEFALWRVELE